MIGQSREPFDAEPGGYNPSHVRALKNVLEEIRRLLVGEAGANEVNLTDLVFHLAETEESPWTVLREGMFALGHDLRLSRHSVQEIVSASSSRTPVVGRHGDGSWVIVLGESEPGQIEVILEAKSLERDYVYEFKTLTLTELCEVLQVQSAKQPLDWGFVIPGFAMAEIKSHKGPAKKSPYSRLISMLKPEAEDLRTIVVFSLYVGVLGLATPIAVELLVNSVAFGGLIQPVVVLAIILFLSLGLGALLKAYQAYVIELLQRRLFVRLVADLSVRLPRVGVNAFGAHYPPEMVNRFFDILTVQKVASKLLLSGIAIVLSASVGLVILAFYHPYLLAFDIVLVSSLLFVILIMGRNGVKTAIDESYKKYDVADWMQELARQPQLFKTGTGLELARERADRLAEAYLDARGRHYSIVFRQLIGSLFLQVIASSLLLGIGGWLVNAQQLTLGQLVASWLIVSVVLSSITKLGELVESWYDLLASMDKIGSLVDLPMESQSGTLIPSIARPASLAVRKIDLAYGSHRVLRDISFEAQAGSLIGVRGRSGAGKSTLLAGLCGILPPVKGFVEWAGEDLRDINVHSLRQDAALVSNGFLLKGSIADNLRCDRPNITLHEMREALEQVQLLGELRALSDGLQTLVTTAGRPLSSGQIQRLLIARAILGQPRLLLLDSVLDSLDAVARTAVLKSLRAHSQHRIIVLVTQNDDLMKLCDQVIDLNLI